MRRLLVPVVAGLVLVAGAWSTTAVGSSTDGRGTFIDDDGSIHEADINGLAASDITRGCNPPDNTEFCPTRAVTRAEMATFLVRALDLPAGDSNFTDIAGSIHAADIDRLAAAQITIGCNPPDNTRYCPDQAVTRQQMASFLVRALDLAPTDDSPFTDTSNSVHREDIDALAAADITKGCNPPGNTRFCPTEPVTRQQMASFLVRALDIDPIRNRLSLVAGSTCAKDGETCSARVTLHSGIQLDVVDGWYQVLPYRSGEESAFNSSQTTVRFTWNGDPLPATHLGVDASSSPAERLWRATPAALTPGTHTLRGVWRWDGTQTRTITYVIVVP